MAATPQTETAPVQKHSGISAYVALLIVFWTAGVAASLFFNIHRTYTYAEDSALIQARTAFEKDIVYRRWNSQLGGVYVKVTDKTQPNPYLADDPTRDIPGPGDIHLTKINPAYMTRLVHELGELKSGVRGHITSTLPIRAANNADEWEQKGLLSLEKDGVNEVAELQLMDGKEYLRYISPLVTEQSCLTCHAFQGYKVGDQRGGISVSVPMAPLRAGAAAAVTTLALSHGAMWIVGVLALALGGARLNRHIREQEELRASKEAAESADRAKSEFLANMSHEIRTPLNGVVGMADLLLRSGLDADKTSMAVTIKTAGESLLAVVNDILDFSKIEAGKMDIDLHPFSLRDTVFDAVKGQSPAAYKKNLELSARIERQTPDRLIGDAHRIRQVLLNLTGNAVKFTEQGEVALTVRVLARTASAATLRFAVTDTGIGIPPDKQRHIFSAFEQADSSTTRKYGGTGLGLSISHRLVKLMGGVLRLEQSRPGHGSTFSFDLELPTADDAAAPEPSVSAEPLKDMPVLVVDDNAVNRKFLLEQLVEWGMRPEESAGADEAMRILRAASAVSAPFALVLTDLQMPEKDGIALIKAMRADAATASVPAILLSSGDPVQGVPAGLCAAKLAKPVRPGDLLRAVASAVGIRVRVDPEPLPVRAGEDAERRSVRNLSVLLVEDMPMNRFVASRMLNNLGHTVTVAGNGQEALDILAEKSFDIVFMDIQMPVMDGTRAVAEIRAAEAARGGGDRLPVVAMTAHALKGDKEKYLSAGMDAYISKPVLQAEIAAVVEDLARRFTLGARADEQPAGQAANRPASGKDSAMHALLDPELMEQVFAGDTELAAQSMLLYLRDAPGLLAEIATAVALDDNAGLADRAHALKGLTGHYTRNGVFSLCLQAERMGREQRLPAAKDDAARCSALLGAKTEELMRAMDAYIAARSGKNA
ncbi:MAG: response regulator [Desulfovibrio sp.]|jgi:signal transduction histidine kinase/CheY-like chemotaxis protein|nr:response regulator [Desulfovibrio sp.]